MTYETDFGVIDVHERDFLLLPKGVTYRVEMHRPQETLRVIYESAPEIFLVPVEMVDHGATRGDRPSTRGGSNGRSCRASCQIAMSSMCASNTEVPSPSFSAK
jgi:hypothetical protein